MYNGQTAVYPARFRGVGARVDWNMHFQALDVDRWGAQRQPASEFRHSSCSSFFFHDEDEVFM